MTKPPKLASFRTTKATAPHTRLKRVSGNAIGSRSKKIVACEQCNFMVIHSPASKTANPNPESKPGDFLPGSKFKTGSVCPRCDLPLLRLFDSQAEFGRAQELKILKSKGYVTDLRYQVPYPLTCNGRVVAKYIADFVYFDTILSKEIVEDVKPKGGLVTDVFILKKAMFEACYDRPIAIVER
jgi:Protein of unknown function (DUF1064)